MSHLDRFKHIIEDELYREQVQWIIDCHKKTNHLYDDYIPYEFHLRLTAKIGFEHLALVPEYLHRTIMLALWGHDLIEDARVTYNDVVNVLEVEAADIIFAVTNMRGKTRSERANDEYYQGIRETEGAVFVKLCDRAANLTYSDMVGSTQLAMYNKEKIDFFRRLEVHKRLEYEPLIQKIEILLMNHKKPAYANFIL